MTWPTSASPCRASRSTTRSKVAKNLTDKLGGEVTQSSPTSPSSPSKASASAATPASASACSKRSPTPSINVEMVSTSEIRVNVVVEAAKGAAGLAALKEAFADVLG